MFGLQTAYVCLELHMIALNIVICNTLRSPVVSVHVLNAPTSGFDSHNEKIFYLKKYKKSYNIISLVQLQAEPEKTERRERREIVMVLQAS